MSEKNKLVGYEATKEQLAEWEQAYGKGAVMRIEITEAKKACYLKPVDRKIMSFISQITADPIRYNESLLEQCWLAGDEEIKTKDKYFMSIMGDLAELMEFFDTKLTKI